MAKTLALIAARPQFEDILRGLLVIGCALVLILAGQAFPSVL